MPSCLGIYIENNLIKYAKVNKDRNNFKVEAYGVKFYEDNIEKTIEQIVKETYSYQVPISVNINKENYTYSKIFNLLKDKDLEKAIETEFEFFCNNNNKNKNTLEFRRIKTNDLEDRDKIRVIYTYIDKASVVERLQLLDKYKARYVFPIATIIQNLNRASVQENSIIVNIEEETEITTLVNGKVYKVDKIEQGMANILKVIAERENSIKKAYEICKNTTVYTRTGQNLKIEGNEYLDIIIEELLAIIDKVKENIISRIHGPMTSAFAQAQCGFGQVAKHIMELSKKISEIVAPEFSGLGFEMSDFRIENADFDDETKDLIRTYNAQSIEGKAAAAKIKNLGAIDPSSMGNYAAVEQLKALNAAAGNQNGLAGMGIGMGMGFGMGGMNMGMGMMQQAQQAQQIPMTSCKNCGAQIKATAKFCPECGKPNVTEQTVSCKKCGAQIKAGAKFCPECGAPQQAETKKCPKCSAEVEGKFCPECGTSI